VEVDLGAFARNLQAVLRAAPGASVLPMIKADAYGLGAETIWRAAQRALPEGALWGFGVAAVAESEALRRQGWQGRILIFPPIAPGEYRRAAAAGVTLALSDVESVRSWASAARDAGRRLAFHAEIDTGMGRAGFSDHEVPRWAAEVIEAAGDLLVWEGCFTHFHSADEPELEPTDAQQERFRRALAALPPASAGGPGPVLHSANSAAALRRAGFGGALVRPGIYLYGGDAGPGVHPEAVATVRARVVRVREVSAGDTLGYGATYAARGAERWATLAIGYGDGLPRRLATSGGEVMLNGRRVPIIGRISMDVTVVDVTQLEGEVRPGDVATLFGGAGEIALEEVARRCGTISYEILTGLGARLPRVARNSPAGSAYP
jgi:alanine racemase